MGPIEPFPPARQRQSGPEWERFLPDDATVSAVVSEDPSPRPRHPPAANVLANRAPYGATRIGYTKSRLSVTMVWGRLVSACFW